jgi:hypothetical protein
MTGALHLFFAKIFMLYLNQRLVMTKDLGDQKNILCCPTLVQPNPTTGSTGSTSYPPPLTNDKKYFTLIFFFTW